MRLACSHAIKATLQFTVVQTEDVSVNTHVDSRVCLTGVLLWNYSTLGHITNGESLGISAALSVARPAALKHQNISTLQLATNWGCILYHCSNRV